MKTLKPLFAALMIVISLSAFAGDDANSERLTVNYALQTYINAISKGEIKGFPAILDSDTKFTSSRGNKIVSQSKSDVLEFMKQNENIRQNCDTDYKFLEMSNSQAVVKVAFKYPGFTKTNLVTMVNTSKGWKITNVATSFE